MDGPSLSPGWTWPPCLQHGFHPQLQRQLAQVLELELILNVDGTPFVRLESTLPSPKALPLASSPSTVPARPELFAQRWDSTIPEDRALIVPVGDVPVPEGGWSWAHDQASRAIEVLRQTEGIAINDQLVFVGFSAGATLSLELAGHATNPQVLVMLARSQQTRDSSQRRSAISTFRSYWATAWTTAPPTPTTTWQKLVAETLIFAGVGRALPQKLGTSQAASQLATAGCRVGTLTTVDNPQLEYWDSISVVTESELFAKAPFR